MSRRVNKHRDLLRFLATATRNTQKEELSNSSKEFIETICEICLNILKSRINLTKKDIGKLGRHKRDIRKLANKKVAINHKRRIVQKGGFISSLLGPLLGSLLAPILGRK